MKGYYINLRHRTDRRDHITKNIQCYPLFSDCVRFDAIQDTEKGYVGCIKSHISALERLYDDLSSHDDAGIILEDDICVINESKMSDWVRQLHEVLHTDTWDMITLTPRGEFMTSIDSKMETAGFYRMVHTQTATGYIIRKRMIPALIELWKESCVVLETYSKHVCDLFAADQSWKTLHTVYRVISYKEPIFGQLVGFSDIEGKHINYNKHFTTV